MWCWIILVMRLVILLTYPDELSSQQLLDCGHDDCGYNATCYYDNLWRPRICNCTTPPRTQHLCFNGCGAVTCGANKTCAISGNQQTRHCVCAPGYLPHEGRCVAGCEINPCAHPMQVCRVTHMEGPLCTCKDGYYWENGTCWKMCKGHSDCSENSTCLAIREHVFICVCKPGYNRTLTGQCVAVSYSTNRTSTFSTTSQTPLTSDVATAKSIPETQTTEISTDAAINSTNRISTFTTTSQASPRPDVATTARVQETQKRNISTEGESVKASVLQKKQNYSETDESFIRMIAAAVVGALFGITVIGVTTYCVIKHRRSIREASEDNPEVNQPTYMNANENISVSSSMQTNHGSYETVSVGRQERNITYQSLTPKSVTGDNTLSADNTPATRSTYNTHVYEVIEGQLTIDNRYGAGYNNTVPASADYINAVARS